MSFQTRLLDAIAQAIVATDLHGRILYWNRYAEKLFGWSSAEVLGRDITEMPAPEHARAQAREILRRLQRGESWSGEFLAYRKDGSSFPTYIVNAPILDEAGARTGLVFVSTDITQRIQAEALLRRSDRRAISEYEALLDRLASLSQSFATARELVTVFRALHGFTLASAPCTAFLISLYDAAQETRRLVYMWYHDEEAEVSQFAAVPVRQGPAGRAIKTGSAIISNDYIKDLGNRQVLGYGFDKDFRYPQSALMVPMIGMGKTIGVIEIQSYDLEAYQQEHVTAMRMAANLAAVAIENVQLLEQERRHQEELRQSQKMEAVGRLAGGIAHDFNNLLTAINGYSEIALMRFRMDEQLKSCLVEIKKAGERAATLTRQLLAFSRKQVLEVRAISLNSVVAEMTNMLERLIGADVELHTSLAADLGVIKADPGQIEQVIVNLAVNARDAMPQGGNLRIETGNFAVEEGALPEGTDLRPGQYVLLAISDSGDGITAEVLPHIFEPFFTTKEQGKGTGLGLATVYGIVKQSGGYLHVETVVGKGTTFKIYLPKVTGTTAPLPDIEAKTETARGSETILVVEDQEMVRNLACQILHMQGYQTLQAADGKEALAICRENRGPLDLVLTDVVMPQMSGKQLVEALAELHPHLKVVYMSGYTEESILPSGKDSRITFLHKPFTPDALARKVREVLTR